jgi:hypothetical protein
MEDSTNKLNIDAKKALIGGVIAIILSPISIVIAFYLGQQLERPKLSITNIEQSYKYQSPDLIIVPDSVLNPVKGNFEITILSDDLDESDFENPLKKDDAADIISSLNSVSAKYNFTITIVSKDIQLIQAWDGKKPLNLEMINPSVLGGKSIYDLVKSDRQNAIAILQSLQNTANSRKKDITNYINFVSPYLQNKEVKERTGEVSFIVGVLNSGKTDAVVFPKAEVIFNGKTIYYSAAKSKYNNSGYSVIGSHSFKPISFELDTEFGNKKDIDEWFAMIKNHTTGQFDFSVSSSDKNVIFSSQLEAK